MSEITIQPLEAGHAASLIDCFRACYGESYPNDTFYNLEKLQAQIHSGALRSVVAVMLDKSDQPARVVGHTGLRVMHPAARSAEAGNTVVAPDMRGRGLLGQLGTALRQRTIDEGFAGYVHYPTTAHEIMQKSATSGSGRETGIMLGYIPAETDYSDFEKKTPGRLAATIVYQPVTVAPAESILVPARYRHLIDSLAHSLSLTRTVKTLSSRPINSSRIETSNNPKRGLRKVTVLQAGLDLVSRIQALPGDFIHVDLPMDDPGIERAADDLAAAGFVYCGWLPGFRQSDVLRLQRVSPADQRIFQPDLVTPAANQLLALITAEQQAFIH